MKQHYRHEIKNLVTLAIPVMIAQISQTAITFVDTIMAGNYSKTALSGVAIAVSIWLPTILFGQGLLTVLTPIISNLNGAAKREQVADQTRQGVVIALILSIIMMLVLYNSDKIISFRSSADHPIDPEMVDVAVSFLRSIMWGVPAFLLFLVYRNQCEGLSNTKPAMVIIFIALLANIPINYVLIYGKLGLPAFGGVGCGITAAIIFWLMFALIRIYTLTTTTQRDIRKTPLTKLIDFAIIKKIVVLGTPLALAYFFEMSLFAVVALLIAPLGQITVAAHQIIFTISSLTFAIPLSLGVATSIRVGYLLGKNKPILAKQTAYVSLAISFMIAVVVALILVVFRSPIITIFTHEIDVITICLQLIILLAIYQVSDYLQVVASNVLRGYKDTKSIFFITLISYWVVGLPVGYILGLTDLVIQPIGAAGFWIGIILGLAVAAFLLIGRMIYIQKQPQDIILKRASR
ncbi:MULTISPECIES: MATE family efflux transporter [unclassified Gilliamella]|uniref:MATE family efflux transporter n=1 Tax=unclassified Gilliamella TaxID=2685620 RepID=UPI00226A328A|nr:MULTISPECIES: MATE family efflux transporter [unclassified Gilliamella]MCX8583562.1 MATE family efflux transporter [Gilliamella sp. B3372]MCX8585084.1 MATE family efflux transporter [Gilliamella sp. B3562]MCX8593961.1 MATE family efflux transporter [Gilliamella sp. B3367]MCX8596717.1 MATE family efflux transporter [Gilliamella sp. B3493]MCX8598445.1 MATE family efflux transporter [Gilliamella sp. B3486]